MRDENEVIQVNVIGSDGANRPHRCHACNRQLTTLFGDVMVTRSGYSRKAAGISALYPAEGRLNIAPDQYSEGVRQRVATHASLMSFSETSETMQQTTGSAVGKRQCEELVVSASQDFEAFYDQRSVTGAESTED